jgi:ribonuclease D
MQNAENHLEISITKEQISTLPQVVFHGDIFVIDDAAKARMALRDLNKYSLVGFDTETRPSFRKGKVNLVALIQISTDDHCYLFRINKIGMFEGLKQFIENDKITKVGLSLHDDFNVLHRSGELTPGSFIDLQSLVKEYSINDIGLQRIYAILFGERISKNQRLSNWEADSLTDSQQMYAAIDAWACLRIYHELTSGNFHPDDSPYIHIPEIDEE